MLEQDLGLLEGLEDSRSVFYRAQTLRFLGRTDEAIGAYRERVELGGWDEELWYSQYQAAVLAGDVDELLMVHRLRPWRHEPLTAAARIVAARDNPDILFNEVI